jgi:hypothetical protein
MIRCLHCAEKHLLTALCHAQIHRDSLWVSLDYGLHGTFGVFGHLAQLLASPQYRMFGFEQFNAMIVKESEMVVKAILYRRLRKTRRHALNPVAPSLTPKSISRNTGAGKVHTKSSQNLSLLGHQADQPFLPLRRKLVVNGFVVWRKALAGRQGNRWRLALPGGSPTM